MSDPATPKVADLVLEGGGVRGIAHLGALTAFRDAGIRPHRIAGCSAGAIMGSFAAAGLDLDDLKAIYMAVDYRSLLDPTWLRRLPIPRVNAWLSDYFYNGSYQGKALQAFIAQHLGDAGVKTWAQLRLDDPDADQTMITSHYKLVVIVSDVTRTLMLRLPWDFAGQYGLDPDAQPVVRDVYASAAVPEFHVPTSLVSSFTGQTSLLADGGLCSGNPVETFDRHDGEPPRWPTFDVGLGSHRAPASPVPDPAGHGLSYLQALVTTATEARDNINLADPDRRLREILLPVDFVDPEDFGLSRETQQRLYDVGYQYTADFLAAFSWSSYLQAAARRPRWPVSRHAPPG